MKKLLILPLLSVAVAICMPRMGLSVNAMSEDEWSVQSEMYQEKIAELETTEDKYQWYLEFQDMISDWEDVPEEIYDEYNDEDLIKMFRVVEAEVGGHGFDEKCNVASVILNRVNDGRFGNSLGDVLVANQFATISDGRYKKVEVSDETISACEFVFQFGDSLLNIKSTTLRMVSGSMVLPWKTFLMQMMILLLF